MALVGPATRRRERRGPDGLGRDRQELGRIPLAARVARPAPRVDRPVGARCVPHVRDPGRVVASGARRVGPASLLRPSGPHLARRQPGSLHPRQGLERSGARGPGPTGGTRDLGGRGIGPRDAGPGHRDGGGLGGRGDTGRRIAPAAGSGGAGLHRDYRVPGLGSGRPHGSPPGGSVAQFRPLPLAAVAESAGLSLLSWVTYGVAFWLLARGLGLPGALPVARAAGVFALGHILGLLALFAPGGVGVREVVLIGLLTPALGGGGAVALSVASRILLTVTEVVAPLCALLVTRDVKEDVSVRT